MKIGDVMTKLQAYEQALTITDPVVLAVPTGGAHLYIPDKQDAGIQDPIGFFNGWTLLYEKRLPNGQREHKYTVGIQLLVTDPSLDYASRIASSFYDALLSVLDLHQTLEGNCTEQSFRGAAPTLTRLDWANKTYIGCNLLLDVVMRDTTTAGA